MSGQSTVRISQELYDRILKKVEESNGEFKDPEAYVIFVLSMALADEEESNTLSKGDEEQVQLRLKSLGYS